MLNFWCLMTSQPTEVKQFLLLHDLPDERLMRKYLVRVVIPNLLKFVEGMFVHAVSFVLIVKSNDVIELFKDFSAIQLVSVIDNAAFVLCHQGFLGKRIGNKAKRTCEAKLKKDMENCNCFLSCCVFTLLLSSIGAWSYFIHGQMSGNFARLKYPLCEDLDAGYFNFLSDGVC